MKALFTTLLAAMLAAIAVLAYAAPTSVSTIATDVQAPLPSDDDKDKDKDKKDG